MNKQSVTAPRRSAKKNSSDAETVFGRSVDETAKFLSVGRTTIYKLIGQRQLDAVSLGGRTIVTNASVQRLIAALPAAPIGAPAE